jgi:hypothetical protein
MGIWPLEVCMTNQPTRSADRVLERRLNELADLRQQIRQNHVGLDTLTEPWLGQPLSPAVALYLHALCVEDITIQSILRRTAPVFTSVRPTKDGPSLREYARAVYAATDAYLAALPPDGLGRSLDLVSLGLGHHPVGWVIHRFLVVELARICTEISPRTSRSLADRRRTSLPRNVARWVMHSRFTQ